MIPGSEAAPTRGVGAITKRDRHREAALERKLNEAQLRASDPSFARGKRRHLRETRRYQRALAVQRKRPQSVLNAVAFCLGALLLLVIYFSTSWTVALTLLGLLLIDLRAIRRRRRKMRD